MRPEPNFHAGALKLKRTASALLAAVFIMLSLLFASMLPELQQQRFAALYLYSGLAAFNSKAKAEPDAAESTEAAPTQAADEVIVRLVDVDNDVAPDTVARLIGITAEVLDKNGGFTLNEDGPRVLIYHTHDTEAYTQTPKYTYKPSGDWRTEDQTMSVVAVGEELARILNEDYGIMTIHDTTCHEKPLITTAYTRSLETMERYKEQYPTLEMFIDLHRDGVPAEGYEDDYIMMEGTETARLMFVVGTGQGKNGNAAEPLPDFESNYALALGLTEKLLSYNERFTRNVRVKTGRYNQHVSSKCILVEVGHNANTLEQALAAMPYLARAIAEVAGVEPAAAAFSLIPQGTQPPEPTPMP